MPNLEKVQKTKNLHREVILSMPNVVGIGAGYKVVGGETTEHLCIITLVKEKIPALELPPSARVPPRIDDILTDVVEVGEIRAQQDHTARWRPAPAGVSLGHYQITAGTFGCTVHDRNNGELLILSNNHVLANSNDALEGDPILQPGAADGGQNPQDAIASLARFIPIHFTDEETPEPPPSCLTQAGILIARFLGMKQWLATLQTPTQPVTNLVDAAVARPLNNTDILDTILEIGKIEGVLPAELGMNVRKSGRTTGLTTGTITVIDATVTVGYNAGRMARFDNQILTGPMSEGGDSGSLLVNGESLNAVALLFAGSDKTTVFSPIQTVFDALEITL